MCGMTLFRVPRSEISLPNLVLIVCAITINGECFAHVLSTSEYRSPMHRNKLFRQDYIVFQHVGKCMS
jgi:hypothetical protein